jgi:multicomponent Na+:H+ antiporter subunit E
MTSTGAISPAALARSLAARSAALLFLWIIVSGGGAADILVGLVAALAAAAVSLRLLGPGTVRVRPIALVGLVARLLQQSLIAGADVARRALDPQLPINPGFVRYSVGLPPGAARNIFTTLMSLIPGTVPIGVDQGDAHVIHCLDVRQPIAVQLAAEEARLVRALGQSLGDG